MKLRYFMKIVFGLFFLNSLFGIHCCHAENRTVAQEPVSNIYEEPGKWQFTPEKSFYFSVNGLVNDSYYSSKIDTSAPPLNDFIANHDKENIVNFCEAKAEIKRGMLTYMLTASGAVQMKIEKFQYDIPPYALSFKFAENLTSADDMPLFVVSQKPIEKIAILSRNNCDDNQIKAKLEKELKQFFASDTMFIPASISLKEAKSLELKELEKFIDQKMKIRAVKICSNSLFQNVFFVEGGFEVSDSYEENFSAVFLPDGKFQVFPNFEISSTFLINDKLYFWGQWSYPETGWNDYRVFKVEGDSLVIVFNENALSD